MCAGDEVEEVAAGIGGEEKSLRSEIFPCHPLADEKCDAERDGGGEPRSGATRGRTSHAEPFFHHVDFVKELAARHLHGDGGEDEDGGVEVEDGRDIESLPVENVGAMTVEVSGGLTEEKGRYQGHEKHEVAGESG